VEYPNVKRREFVQWVVDKVEFPEYVFRVVDAAGLALFVQGEYWEADTVTGVQNCRRTRLWLVADQTEDEIVRTMFKIIMTSMEHKARSGSSPGYVDHETHTSAYNSTYYMMRANKRGKYDWRQSVALCRLPQGLILGHLIRAAPSCFAISKTKTKVHCVQLVQKEWPMSNSLLNKAVVLAVRPMRGTGQRREAIHPAPLRVGAAGTTEASRS